MTPKGMEEVQRNSLSFVQEYQSILYMLMVPIYALISKLVFRNIKKFNYTEHVVINMYLSAHFNIVSSILIVLAVTIGINYLISGLAAIVLRILYSTYVFKHLYKMNLKRILLKTLWFLVILALAFILLSIATAVIMYLNGDFQKILENSAILGN